MRLAFVGDIALGDHPKTVGFGLHSQYPHGIPLSLAGRLRPPGPRPDVFFGNLEFCLGADPAGATELGERQCRGSDANARFLAAAGLSVLNIANNHSAQHGHPAFHATVDVVRAAGIRVIGTPLDFGPANDVEASGCRIAFLGWSDRPRQYASEAPPYNELGEHASDAIRAARARADLVVASVHWGEEFVQVPRDRERRLARAMVDAGASIVIGHHPHVLREVESYRGGLIAYSLGNFVGDMTWNPETRLGGCLVVDLTGREIDAHALVLSRIERDYLPSYLCEGEASSVAAMLERRRRSQERRIADRGYDAVVAEEHRRHVRATGLMMVRSLHRYPRGTLVPMVSGALRGRLVGGA